MANNSKITGIRKKASAAIDRAEGTIGRFTRFMGVVSKSGNVPDKSTLKKARKFAKNFGGKRSSRVSKLLLGSAVMLPMVLGTMMAKNQSTEDILQNQYGGDEKAMQNDLKEEQKIRDKGLEKVEATADENKDISMDRQKDISDISQQKDEIEPPPPVPESEVKPEQSEEDKTTLEKLEAKVEPGGALTEDSVKKFDELIERFRFLEFQGAFLGGEEEKQKNILQTGLDFVRTVVQSVPDDGYWGPRWLGIKNPFSPRWKDEKSKNNLEALEKEVESRLAANEASFKAAGGIRLDPDSEEMKEYLKTKTELEKLKKKIQNEPLTVIKEASALGTGSGDGSTVLQQSSMLNLTIDASSVPVKVKNDLEFQQGVEQLAQKYNVSVQDLYAVMSFETGGTFDPAQKNLQGSGATGLIQFMPSTAKGLGTSTEELSKMTRTEQLKYVDKYFSNKGIEGGNLDDLYMAILFPVAVGKPDNFVLFGEGAIEGFRGTAYEQNSGLDLNRDGSITKAEAAAKVREHYSNMQFVTSDGNVTKASLQPGNPNRIANLEPTGYMPYENTGVNVDSPPQIVLSVPQTQPLVTRMSGNGSGDSPVISVVQDSGALLAQMQLHSLALT